MDETPTTAIQTPRPHVAIITGLSGAGKTTTSKLFEDLGYRVVDNLPSELLRDLAELIANDPVRFERVALVLDVRTGDAPLAFGAAMGALEGRGIQPQVFFLEARRRGPHPSLQRDPPPPPARSGGRGVAGPSPRSDACSKRSASRRT